MLSIYRPWSHDRSQTLYREESHLDSGDITDLRWWAKMQYEAFVSATDVEVRRTMGDTIYLIARRYKATQKYKLSKDACVDATSGLEAVSLG